EMDDYARQNPAYRPAKGRPRFGGVFLFRRRVAPRRDRQADLARPPAAPELELPRAGARDDVGAPDPRPVAAWVVDVRDEDESLGGAREAVPGRVLGRVAQAEDAGGRVEPEALGRSGHGLGIRALEGLQLGPLDVRAARRRSRVVDQSLDRRRDAPR